MERINLSEIDGLNNAVRLCEVNGPYPGNITGIDSIHFCTMDHWNPWINNSCKILSSECSYSFAKSIYVEIFDWDEFYDVTGIERIWDIALCMEDLNYLQGVDVLALPPVPIKNYKQATGLIGVTGDCITDEYKIRNFDEFLFEAPYIIASGPFNSEFKTNLGILQIRISPDAYQGGFRFPNFYVSGVID